MSICQLQRPVVQFLPQPEEKGRGGERRGEEGRGGERSGEVRLGAGRWGYVRVGGVR